MIPCQRDYCAVNTAEVLAVADQLEAWAEAEARAGDSLSDRAEQHRNCAANYTSLARRLRAAVVES